MVKGPQGPQGLKEILVRWSQVHKVQARSIRGQDGTTGDQGLQVQMVQWKGATGKTSGQSTMVKMVPQVLMELNCI